MLDELAEFTDEIGNEESRGTVVLSAEPPLLRYQLPRIVESFRQERRLAHLRVLSRGTSEPIGLVRRNEVDLGVIYDRRPMPPEVVFHPWRTFKAYVLVPRGHPLARRKVPTMQDIMTEETLSRYPQVVAEIDNREQLRVKSTLERLGLPFNVALECQWRSKKGPPRRCKKGPLGGCGLVPVVHGRAPRATRRALNRLTRRRAREGPVGPRGQAWAGWSVQLAVVV